MLQNNFSVDRDGLSIYLNHDDVTASLRRYLAGLSEPRAEYAQSWNKAVMLDWYASEWVFPFGDIMLKKISRNSGWTSVFGNAVSEENLTITPLPEQKGASDGGK